MREEHEMNIAVAGRQIKGSINEHLSKLDFFLEQEQEKLMPDNFLIDVLCDSVRLAREYADSMSLTNNPNRSK